MAQLTTFAISLTETVHHFFKNYDLFLCTVYFLGKLRLRFANFNQAQVSRQ